jgi:hypothetical protein
MENFGNLIYGPNSFFGFSPENWNFHLNVEQSKQFEKSFIRAKDEENFFRKDDYHDSCCFLL